jgi:hypothetical protein
MFTTIVQLEYGRHRNFPEYFESIGLHLKASQQRLVNQLQQIKLSNQSKSSNVVPFSSKSPTGSSHSYHIASTYLQDGGEIA